MSIITPTITKIIRMTEFDLLRTSINIGNMYMCLDSQNLYYDETESRRVLYYYVGVKTYNDLIHNITPAMNTTYYCWENNSLWLWMNKWITLWSDRTYPSAYVYDNESNLNEVYRNNQPLLPADDNGLLGDGSVVIRDRQRIIKGKLSIDDGNDNLVISSFLGGGMRLLPNGQLDTEGELYLCDDNASQEPVATTKTAQLTYSASESTVEISVAALRNIQTQFNANNCSAPATLEVEDIIYNLSNSPQDTEDVYIAEYVQEDDNTAKFTVIVNIHYIPSDGKVTYSFLRSEFHTLNNEMYVDFSEEPGADYNLFVKPSHKYKVYHEGNLDASVLHIMTPTEIYNKLLDEELPNPLAFNVTKLNGKADTDFAATTHSHLSSDISDFNSSSRAQALLEIKDVFSTMTGQGITVDYNTQQSVLSMSANDFVLTFSNGVTGSGTVRHLGNTTIPITVDPSRHIHQDYIDTMNNLQRQVDDIRIVNPEEYYTKVQTNEIISSVAGTALPTSGKPLLVDANLKLPGVAGAADKLSSLKAFNYQGDITGTGSTDFSSNTLNINLSADNIISATPESGKALKVNADGNLPVNALTSSSLDHDITFRVIGEATGTGTLDTSSNTFDLNIALQPNSNILQRTDLGVLVASLDNTGKILSSQLPDFVSSLSPQGYFNPNNGAPDNTPEEGQFWVANTAGSFESNIYQIGDWCVYLNGAFNHINTNSNVVSVNSHTGIVELTAQDIDAISTTYIDYVLGNVIPSGKVVRTSGNGIITGASVANLTSPFEILTDSTGDIAIADNSINTSTDGTANLNIKLQITESGYNNIFANTGIALLSNGSALARKPELNFGGGLAVIAEGNNRYTLSATSVTNDFMIIYYDADAPEASIAKINDTYDNRMNVPIIVIDGSHIFNIDKSYPDRTPNGTITIPECCANFDWHLNATAGTVAGYDTNFNMLISFTSDAAAVVDAITITSSDNAGFNVLTTNTLSGITAPFSPTQAYHPATKDYVDRNIASLNTIEFTVLDADKYTSETLAVAVNALFDNRATKPIMIITNYINHASNSTTKTPHMFLIDNNISRVTSRTILVPGVSTYQMCTEGEDEYVGTSRFESYRDNLCIDFDASNNITSVSFYSTTELVGAHVITACHLDTDLPYLAETPADPVSKAYLDAQFTNRTYKTTIGDSSSKIYTVTHNLNSEDVIVQFRHSDTKQMVTIDNTIVDGNTITINSSIVLGTNEITVLIMKL